MSSSSSDSNFPASLWKKLTGIKYKIDMYQKKKKARMTQTIPWLAVKDA